MVTLSKEVLQLQADLEELGTGKVMENIVMNAHF